MKKGIIISAIVSIIVAAAIGIYFHKERPLPLRTDLSLYDSAGNLVAFKHKKEWHILDEEKTAEALLREALNLNRYNQVLSYKYDSILRHNNSKK